MLATGSDARYVILHSTSLHTRMLGLSQIASVARKITSDPDGKRNIYKHTNLMATVAHRGLPAVK